MFFILSKTLGFFAWPSNFLISIGLVGIVLLCTRFWRLASWLVVTSVVLIAFAGFSPLGNILILPLERVFRRGTLRVARRTALSSSAARFCRRFRWRAARSRSMNAAERITATAELARRYPDARIIFSGGTNSLVFDAPAEAPVAVKELEALGVAHDRITAEEQSRNTIENAVFSRLLAKPKPGERWLLVTSAFHMPRAIAAFRAAGFPVEPYPVDWRTRGPPTRQRHSARCRTVWL